ncbi:MAG: hypothetical protein BWK80_44335 [Desulfobacteraceae bacterium IS3]|nr:MAG: hypothetical protein BWK80_44335 [Desulfobacteraceae bacterium IS3]
MNNGEMKAEDISLKEDTDRLIRNHVLGSMGVGLIPFPVLDIVAMAGVQLNMLRRLAERYNVPFSKDMGKHLIASLLGGGLPMSVGGTLVSFIKSIPLIGQVGGVLTMPAVTGATTYAVGKVFIQHFESGGTFLDFDPETVRAYYAEMFKEGEKVVADLKVSEVFDESENIVTESVKETSVSAVPENIGNERTEPSVSSIGDEADIGSKIKENQPSEPENIGDCDPENPYVVSDSDECPADNSEIRCDEQEENLFGESDAGRDMPSLVCPDIPPESSCCTDSFPDESKKKKKAKRKKAKVLSV